MSGASPMTEEVKFTCRCGAACLIVRDAEGTPAILHSRPECAEFMAIDDPADYLRWVRTGLRPGAPT